MRRLREFTYPDPHEVVLVQRTIGSRGWRHFGRRPIEQVVSVLIDGQAICLPRDADVTVETGPDRAGSVVTIRDQAASVDCGRIGGQP